VKYWICATELYAIRDGILNSRQVYNAFINTTEFEASCSSCGAFWFWPVGSDVDRINIK